MKSLLTLAAHLVTKTTRKIVSMPVVNAFVLAVSLVSMASLTALSISGEKAFAKVGVAANPFAHLSLEQVQALDPNLKLPLANSSQVSLPHAEDYASKAEYHQALLKNAGIMPAELASIDARNRAVLGTSGIAPAYAAIGLSPADLSPSSGGPNTSRGLRH